MVLLKILRITEKRVFERQPLEPFLQSNDLRLSPSSCSFSLSNKPIFLYEIIFTLDDVTHIVIERSKNDVIVLVRSVVLYFPSYEFSAQTLFQPPDQHIRDLRELQEFLNRILSIDVTSRIIKYPKIISFFDPVLGRSVVQRSVLKQNLQSVGRVLISFLLSFPWYPMLRMCWMWDTLYSFVFIFFLYFLLVI